jgi:AraC-like DNA-binding protein
MHIWSRSRQKSPAGIHGGMMIGGTQYPVNRPTLLVIPPGLVHSFDFIFSGQSPFAIILIARQFIIRQAMVSGSNDRKSVERRLSNLAIDHPEFAEPARRLMRQLTITQPYHGTPPPTDDPILRSVADMERVASLLRMVFSAPPMSDPHTTVDIVRRIIDHVQLHFQEELSLDAIASACAASKFHLCRVFKESVGMTIWEYLQDMRLHHATELFLTGNRNVTHVCYEAGFSDPSYFTKVFRKYTGQSPRAWVRTNTGIVKTE